MNESELKILVIAPDGPQGGKVKLGVTGQEQIKQLKEAVEQSNEGMGIENIRKVASEINIPEIDI